MCQMSVVMEKDGSEELVMEDVTNLVVDEDGLTISTLFEGPRTLPQVNIRSIDFMAGKVFLKQAG
jgi:predicted RNA-binding protein